MRTGIINNRHDTEKLGCGCSPVETRRFFDVISAFGGSFFDIGAKCADGKKVVLNVVFSATPPEALPLQAARRLPCSAQYYPIATNNWLLDEATKKHSFML